MREKSDLEDNLRPASKIPREGAKIIVAEFGRWEVNTAWVTDRYNSRLLVS